MVEIAQCCCAAQNNNNLFFILKGYLQKSGCINSECEAGARQTDASI